MGDEDGELLPAAIRARRKSKTGQHASSGLVTCPLAFVTSSSLAHGQRSNLMCLHDHTTLTLLQFLRAARRRNLLAWVIL